MFVKYLDIKIKLKIIIIMKKRTVISALSLCGLIIWFASCEPKASTQESLSEVHSETEPFNYEPTVFPKDTTKLWMGEGNIESDTVFIVGEGGPHNQLYFEFSGKTVWSTIPNFFNYYRVHIFQSTMLNKDIYHWREEFNEEMAILEADNSTEILHRAIDYWKRRGKTVIVAGTSFTAILIPHYLTTRGNHADKYLMSAGRFDVPVERWKYYLRGVNSRYDTDGKTLFYADTTRGPNPFRGAYYFKVTKVKQMIKGVLGRYRYTEELQDMDLSNLVVAYATDDTKIGALSESELEWLKNKNVPVYVTDGGHPGPDRKLVELITNGTVKL